MLARPAGGSAWRTRVVTATALSIGLLFLPGCTDEGVLRGSLVIEGSHVLESGSGHVGVLGGTVRVPEGTSIDGSIGLLGDVLVVNGRIAGDVLVFGGAADFGPTATVDGAIVLAGGDVRVDPEASILGGTREDLDLLADFARPAPTLWDRVSTLAVQGLLLAAVAWVVAAVAPGAVRRMSRAACEHAVVAGAMGGLSALVATVLLVIMAFTVVLIPVTLVLGIVLLVAVALGWVALGRGLAMRFARFRGRDEVRPRDVAAWTLGVMAGLAVLDGIPWVGSIVALSVTVAGFGAVLITGFGTRRFVPDLDVRSERARAGGENSPRRDG